MRRRRNGCLIGIGGVAIALLICCVLGWFVVMPRFSEAIETELSTIAATEVSRQLDRQGPIEAGEYRLSIEEINRQVAGGTNNLDVTGLTITTEGDRIRLHFETDQAGGASAGWTFLPVATTDGELELTDIQGDGGIVRRLLSPQAVAGAVENAVNGYLDAHGLTLTDVYVDGQDVVFVVTD